MRKLMVLLGMSLLLVVLACSADDGFSEDVLASKPTAGQDDRGFSRLVEQASAAPMAAAMEAAPPGAPGAFASDMQVLVKTESESSQGSSGDLDVAERKVIFTAFMTYRSRSGRCGDYPSAGYSRKSGRVPRESQQFRC